MFVATDDHTRLSFARILRDEHGEAACRFLIAAVEWLARQKIRIERILSQCTRNTRSRRISRSANEHVLEEMNERVAKNPELMRRRKAIVEHPFGTIKRWMNQSYFLMRGLEKVRGELSLSALAYNLKRTIAIVGVRDLLKAIA